MPRFFVSPVTSDTLCIDGENGRHIARSLRMRPGETLTLSNGEGIDYLARILSIDGDAVETEILERTPNQTEPRAKLTLFMAMPKGDKMELIVQKSVELGVYQVIPVATKRAVVKLDAKKAARKVERWQQIAQSAAKQAGRGYIPEVADVMPYREALECASKLDVVLIPYELAEGMKETKSVIESIYPGQSIGIFIGPEGGFEKEEVEQALEYGAHAITLGKRILRTETAGLTTLSVLMFHLEG